MQLGKSIDLVRKGTGGRCLRFLCGAVLVIFGQWEVEATHIIGGDLTYRCLGHDLYEIRLTMRRDCFLGAPLTEFDNPASIGVFYGDNFSLFMELLTPLRTDDTLNQHLISDCTISGNDVCVEETIYVDTISLPFYAPGYIIAYQRCCRNMTLQNVVDPLNTGMTLVTRISAEVQMTQNSSPVFGEFPPIYICVDKPISFDFAATDVSGDSLVYELFTPFLGATDPLPRPQPPPNPPYDTVVWATPYHLGNLLGGSDPIRIDRHTGLITGTPILIGQFLVGVRVLAYRDGKLVTAVTREWQYNVRACRDVPIADFDVSSLLNCHSLSVDFTEQSQHADQYLWIFDYGNAGSATSHELNPSFTFTEEGFFDVALIVNDFDSICFDTAVTNVGVFESALFSNFTLDIPECAEEISVHPMDQSDDPHPDYVVNEWMWILSYPGVQDTSLQQNPIFTITQSHDGVLLTLIVTSSNGCTATSSQTFDAHIINVPFAGDTLRICKGSSILLIDGDPGFSYQWSPTSSLDLTIPSKPIASPIESTTYTVTVSDGICTVTDEVHVFVRELPEVEIPGQDTSCFGAPVVLNPVGDTEFSYSWSPAGSVNDPNSPSPIAQVSQTTWFVVTITDLTTEQCQSTDSVLVVVPPDINLGAPADTTYCETPAITLTATGTGLEYIWYTSLGKPIGSGAVITVQPQEETIYILEGRDSFGCEVQTTVTLTPVLFDYTPSEDQRICRGETTVLSIQNNNLAQNLTYLWTPQTGIIGPNNLSSVAVMPLVTTTYTVQILNADLGCTAEETFEVVVSWFDPPELVINVDEDTITLGESFILSTNQDPNLFFFWDGPGIMNPNSATPLGTPASSGIYTYAVTVTNSDGCKLFGSISNLTVVNPPCNMEDVFIPDAFSPNDDGDNDILQVYGNFISALELRIFNRWGEQVFVSMDQNIGWDGRFKGKELAPDVFGYYLRVECPPDKSYFTKGNITLFK